ncbi:VOC family protein [Pseudooctadecabacter jejudonensis]|uniref:Glyoxalase-like domain protein n=1 Tax=Pseudooctadecabacter jejudonensis TaxID=1391910 RepID=A0A1Y5RGS9_9RHOB|nr:VOC family protein [Pseudooctadecabacter jejudonensis]SLN14518.1 Glyoxalase-like domain protein [Pseudooctadecabacter jejudonensis]
MAELEHVNIMVADGAGFAAMLCEVFDWHVRWEGPSTDGAGYTRHVGSETSYVAVYETDEDIAAGGPLGHIAMVVDDLDVTEARIVARGLIAHHHAEYEPGRRFYFLAPEGIEVEVVQYD